MLNLFYQNKTLNDTLIINVSNNKAERIDVNKDVIIGFAGQQLVFINIKNASVNLGSLPNGLLFPNNELLARIKELTNQDLAPLFDNGFKVGLIEQCEDIPNTHLHKCVVDTNTNKLAIVCGAPNARRGLKVVVATNGTMLPSGKQILPGQLLGNKSEGMLCSYRELGIAKESHGIIELDDSYQVGDYFLEVYANKKEQ